MGFVKLWLEVMELVSKRRLSKGFASAIVVAGGTSSAFFAVLLFFLGFLVMTCQGLPVF